MSSSCRGREAIKRSGEANEMMSATSSARQRTAGSAGNKNSTNSGSPTRSSGRNNNDSGKRGETPQDKQRQAIEQQAQQAESKNNSKLVFGLNPRAHRAKRPTEQVQSVTDSISTPINSSSSSQGAESKQKQPNGVAPGREASPTASRNSGQIRASKYGNFYKPQDLTSTPTSSSTSSRESTSGTAPSKAQQQTMTKKSAGASGASSGAAGQPASSKQQQQAQPSAAAGKTQQQQTQAKTTSASVRARSKSPERSSQRMGRRKSFDEDISTIKVEAKPTSEQQQQQQQPVLRARTQFNILPPPQMSIATTGKGSVVDYAKSRIYDRPVKQILANPLPSMSLLDDQPGQAVPFSISSGFKPPKQVNVSKAREKWEGGEPFAKCKSRKRLAAQANKKLFPGTWSMTSVVATQQLHLQQALAQASSSSNNRSNPLQTDPSVKVLTRGSVLERIQQYERVPQASGASGSPSLSGSNSASSLDSFLTEEDDRQISLALSRSSSAASALSSCLGSDGGEVVMTIKQPQLEEDSSLVQTSKQAQYKSRVSSIQQQQQQQQIDSTTATGGASSPQLQQQRRLSLRRRSSVGLLGHRSSTQSLIPKFYHPNGKPNTYEIEIQKRNIAACFDKLPERKAQLTPTTASGANGNGNGPSTARRHFHQIALACGYSEYFKVPLQLYVRYQLETNPKLAAMARAPPVLARKSSTVALNTNGSLPSLRPLVKSASIDSASKKSPQNGDPSSGSAQDDESKKDKVIEFVTCDQFLACWRELISKAFDSAAQFVHLLTYGQRNYLLPEDFVPLVQSIIDDHPGLKFLRAAPDFHMRYIQTVIARIYYCINRSWTGKLSLQELRKSNLLAVLQVLAQEEDINQITDYFSYEHFYVIYCKFWNLDQDHDLFISKEDLARHNDAAISSRIIERIFAGIVSKQIQKTGKMSYSDFVWFLIAEEDKKHPRSIEYWFRLMDLDGDGYISMYEMEYFYYEQMKRLELMNIEALPFLDSACQILDLVNPREKSKISLADLKRTRMATIFFDTFINLEKYLEHESREFVSTRDVVQNGVVVSDWDRYASEEYENLVTEESAV